MSIFATVQKTLTTSERQRLLEYEVRSKRVLP